MLDVGKPCTSTSAGAPGVPHRRLNTVTSCPSLAAVVDRQRSSVPPFCHSAKMSKLPASQRSSRLDNHAPLGARSGERDDDLVRGTGRAGQFECFTEVVERDGVADDQRVFLPVRGEIVGHLEDLIGVSHTPDDVDFVAHHVDELDGYRLFMDAHDSQGGSLFGGGQRGVYDGGRTRGVEVNVGASLAAQPGNPSLALAVQFDEATDDVLVGGVDDGVGADLQCLVQTGGNQVRDHDMAHTKGFEGQRCAQSDRAGAEDDDLVRRFGFATVGAVAGDGHRLVERGDFPRDVVGDDFQTGSADGVLDQQVVGEGPGGSAVADDAAGGGHGVDHDMIPNSDAGHVTADLDDFPGRLVSQRCVPLARRNTADRDVERVGTADAAGAHSHEYVAGADLRAVRVDNLGLTRAGDH